MAIRLIISFILACIVRFSMAQTVDSTELHTTIDTMAISIYQKGEASYYSPKLKGRKTASGEIYYPDSLTAAHLKLPLGTIVNVCNSQDSSCVTVKINDRGPYSKKYVIDLSQSAARQIGLTKALGHIPIWIEIVAFPEKEE